MARKKDLAGLASLAGLAYLASREKGGNAPVEDSTAPMAAAAPAAAPQIEDESDRGSMTPDQLAYDKTSAPAAAPARTPRPKPAAAAPMGGSGRGGQGGPSADELAAYAASQKPKPRYQSLADRARAYEEERAAAGAPGMYGTSNKRREPLPTASDMAYKKGGKVKDKAPSVKGWGSARGARKAKIY